MTNGKSVKNKQEIISSIENYDGKTLWFWSFNNLIHGIFETEQEAVTSYSKNIKNINECDCAFCNFIENS